MTRSRAPACLRTARFQLLLLFTGLLVFIQIATLTWFPFKTPDSLSTLEQNKNPVFIAIRAFTDKAKPLTFSEKESSKVTNERETTTAEWKTTSVVTKPTKTTPLVSTSVNRTVDMENDYYPLVNFNFVWPETKPILKGENDLFLVVLVNSAARGDKYRARRNAIRKTWSNARSCERLKSMRDPKLNKHKWILVFSLGKADAAAENERNKKEAQLNNDILIGDFLDNYLNNVIKVYMGWLWVSSMNVRYILKTDDDIYVRVPLVIDWLIAQNYPSRFYGGAPYFNFIVDRNPHGKWAVSKKYFDEEYFPSFCAGAFYVLSTDIFFELFNYPRRRRPFHTDDAYVGIAARDLNISIHRIPGLLLEDNMPTYLGGFSDCKLLKARGFGHSIEPPLMDIVHNRLNSLCKKNTTC